ncbi:unnamed protein product [Cylicostephanus goldi]|uniref:Isochorismatase domain-containing protein 1 n=1 Tax=Cylicostephanus goldi TaxID=71465 RepID=A0A3P6QWW6_CYLGO|nr:unnamed protein product [Cylicostephanus goldi]
MSNMSYTRTFFARSPKSTGFSMCLPDITSALDKDNVVLVGIEAHVCVLHTALDLLEKGKNVHVVVDAVSSRSLTDSVDFHLIRLRFQLVFPRMSALSSCSGQQSARTGPKFTFFFSFLQFFLDL